MKYWTEILKQGLNSQGDFEIKNIFSGINGCCVSGQQYAFLCFALAGRQEGTFGFGGTISTTVDGLP